jgi:nucleotide-binding universal stress UspA family protein
MNPLRSILLHLDASPNSARRLRVARELAVRHGARMTALYACIPSIYSVPFALADGGAAVFPMLEEFDVQRRDETRARFERATAADIPSMHWHELDAAPLIPGVTAHALCNDLLVLGQRDPADKELYGVPTDFIASLLIASGKPALVLPDVEVSETIGASVLIAWKPTRESAQAVVAALPFLRIAARIHLVAEARGGAGGIEDLIDYLRLHGVEAPIERHAAVSTATPGDGLLSCAADRGCDLLVMGCYGHSRARELVLGGVSRTVLESMTLPVLMAH